MAIRLTFNHDRKNEPPQIIMEKPLETSPVKISNLNLFKRTDLKVHQNELEKNRWLKVEEILEELDSLIGLESVKKLILEIQAFVEIQKRRERENLTADPMVLHMIFKGNPGTGKTTVARIISRLFKEMGLLEKGHVVEVERADLVGEYIGHTAHKTKEQIKKSLGGILFIDEAYSLARGGEKDFGKEAIDTLVKNMEEYKDNLILILAGYKREMEWFLESNPGLRSRFPIIIDFPNYSVPELMDIAQLMLTKRQYQMSEEAKTELETILNQRLKNSHEHSGNARLVRNLIEKAIRVQAVRLVNENSVSRNDLILINNADICLAGDAVF